MNGVPTVDAGILEYRSNIQFILLELSLKYVMTYCVGGLHVAGTGLWNALGSK